MLELHSLKTLISLPILSVLYMIFCCRKHKNKDIFNVAILFSILVFSLGIYLTWKYLYFGEWAEGIGPFIIGIDGLSLVMMLLTMLLVPICLISARFSIQTRCLEFCCHFLMLELAIIGAFLARDLISFYIFFELTLVPMFFIIGIWGGKNRIYATFKLFLYTFTASIFMLLAIVYIIAIAGYPTIGDIISFGVSNHIELALFLCFFVAFAVKLPMFPLHTWLPNAHVEAPTSGSVILAGVLIKLGGYGMIRLVHMMPRAAEFFAQYIIILSIIAIIYASIIAIMQSDIKKMIAYSSIVHMGYVTVGIFSLSRLGINAAIFQMISHGIISSALFLCVGVLYDRLHTRDFSNFGGIANKMPSFAFLLMIFTMGSVGLPGTSGFVGEFMAILAVFRVSIIFAILVGSGIILGACYMLYMYNKTMFGIISNPAIESIAAIHKAELIYLGLLALIVVVLGVYPNILQTMML